MGCEIWQEDLPRNQTRHTLLRPAKRIFHKHKSCINDAHSRLKSFRQSTKYPACGSSLVVSVYSRRMLGKQPEIHHNYFNFSECNPYHSIPYQTIISHFQQINAALLKQKFLNVPRCWQFAFHLLCLPRIFLFPPPYLPPSLQKSSFRLGVKLDPIMLLLFPDFQW